MDGYVTEVLRAIHLGDSRFNRRFNGQILVLVAGANAGPVPYQNGIVINTNGNGGSEWGSRFQPRSGISR